MLKQNQEQVLMNYAVWVADAVEDIRKQKREKLAGKHESIAGGDTLRHRNVVILSKTMFNKM